MLATERMNLIVTLLLVSKAVTAALVVDYVLHREPLFVVEEMTVFMMFVQNHVVYMKVLGSLLSLSETIDRLADRLHDSNAVSLTREVNRQCAELEEKLSFPLKIFHMDYFVVFQSQVPIELPRLKCSGSSPYYIYGMVESFMIFFLLAYAGEVVAVSCKRFRRRLCRTKQYTQVSLWNVQLFRRQVHGINLAFGTPLGLKAFYQFMSVTHGLAMVVFQTVLTYAGCETRGEIE